MRVGVVLPMGSHASAPEPYPVVRSFARHAEELGLDSVWVFEHVLFRFPGQPERGTLEAWTTLAMLGEATTRIELGSLVLGIRLRNPALLAKMAATLDDATGGRLTLGVGAGWHDPEYRAFGYPLDNRLGRTDEALGILRDLLDGKRVTHDGRWVMAEDAVLLPSPARRIPILSSARSGRMMRIVARHADAWNGAWAAGPQDPVLTARMAELDQACQEVGREPRSLARTAGVSVRYSDATLPGPTGDRARDLMGDAAAVAAGLRAFSEAGYSHLMIWLEPMNETSLDRLAEAVTLLRG